MTDAKLLPCPFCGGEVEHQLMFDGAYSFTCRQCGLNARFTDDIARAVPEMIEGTEKLWNTRHERTCQLENLDGPLPEEVMEMLEVWLCSECGSPIYNDMTPTYCPYCGAKVVNA